MSFAIQPLRKICYTFTAAYVRGQRFVLVADLESEIIIIIIIIIFTAIGLLPGGSGYFTCIQNMKLVTTKFNSGGLREKHVVATWNLGNHLSICL